MRAKQKIRQAGIPLRVPEREALPERLDSVLDALYAAFVEGWSDPGGTDAIRRDLTEEALFLAKLVAELLPDEPEALGLLACMLHAEARRGARRGTTGAYIPFAEQDPALWNWPQIYQAEALLRRASGLGRIGRYQLEGALQSAHVYRRYTSQDNWADVLQLYDALLALTASPVVALNRALALAEVQGAASALAIVQALASDERLTTYQPYWAAQAALMARTGGYDHARQSYEIAIGLERDPAVRRFLQLCQLALPPS